MELKRDASAKVIFGSICLYPISPPERNLMAEIWHKYGDMSSNIKYLFLFSLNFLIQLFYGSLTRKIQCGLLVGNVPREVIDE